MWYFMGEYRNLVKYLLLPTETKISQRKQSAVPHLNSNNVHSNLLTIDSKITSLCKNGYLFLFSSIQTNRRLAQLF